MSKSRWELVCRYVRGTARVLDWGCANGAFIRSSPNGFYTAGYDINPHSPYCKSDLYGEKWDAVTLWDVIEHMDSPYDFITGLDTRYLFICTPDLIGAGKDITGWKHYRPDEHQHYFSRDSLIGLYERCGYAVREINRDEAVIRDPEHPNALITMVGERCR